MTKVRIQKYLSDCGVASRRKAEELILEGRVRVNGQIVEELGSKIEPGVDKVAVGRKLVYPSKSGIILLHKSKGVVSTVSDPGGRPTVMDYLPKGSLGYVPVGRLDYDSTGLVVMTNDGELTHRLMHPKFGWQRVYEVKISGHIEQKSIDKIQRGITLDDGPVQAKCEVMRRGKDSTWLKVSLSIGRNRIIRRMFEHFRHPVLKLHRVQHGPFRLAGLKRSEVRILPRSEVDRVREFVFEKSGALKAGTADKVHSDRKAKGNKNHGKKSSKHSRKKRPSRG